MTKQITRIFIITFLANLIGDGILLSIFNVEVFTKQNLLVMAVVSLLTSLVIDKFIIQQND